VPDTKRGPSNSQPVQQQKSPGLDGVTNEKLAYMGNMRTPEKL